MKTLLISNAMYIVNPVSTGTSLFANVPYYIENLYNFSSISNDINEEETNTQGTTLIKIIDNSVYETKTSLISNWMNLFTGRRMDLDTYKPFEYNDSF